MAKANILKESILEARALKQAAIRNAENSLAEHFRGTLETMVEAELNEEADVDTGDEPSDDDTMEETHMEFDPGNDVMSEMEEVEDELDFGEEDDEFEEEGEEGLDLELESIGFSEAELRETINDIFNEVNHGVLGDPEDVDPDTHSTGLMDDDKREDGWQNKTAPASKDWTVKEAYNRMKKMNVRLVAENKSLKKGMAELQKAVRETNLFNKKLFLAHKLMNKHGLTESVKRKVVAQLDNATTAKEAERIYESFETVLGLVSEGRKTRRKTATLSEALGSQKKSERGVTHVDDAHLVNEGARYSKHRFKKLAGLIQD